ncbi:AraC family transcriptional regulator [Shimazuella sp. AN120528]|uniref:AraC family transcriptional regulator n=1 Tax=Shimazuella soli TaxID=1892854 RepID=UPI001F0D1E44|nr:AraC family transcriptional regulator [Shimazuella soli]MCH5585823.1 AraC family transcriptional regulator [Shimazuella soli]
MNVLQSLNHAIEYIEQNLTGEIDFQEVAKRSLCSEYHFRRMFSHLAGVSLSEYIRNRRLTLAAFDLMIEENQRILDIAVKYGYSSADAFTRAFQKFHGILPSEVRMKQKNVKAYPRMTFQLTIRGGVEMNYKIVEKEAFRIVGIKKRVPIVFQGINPEIASMAASLSQKDIKALKQLSNIDPKGIISASINFSEGRMEEKGELDHFIGVATNHVCPPNWVALEVPTATWAVFESIGPFPETLQNVWGRIYSEWFPSTQYEAVNGPEILWNESKDFSSKTFRSEIWIPVRKTGVKE